MISSIGIIAGIAVFLRDNRVFRIVVHDFLKHGINLAGVFPFCTKRANTIVAPPHFDLTATLFTMANF